MMTIAQHFELKGKLEVARKLLVDGAEHAQVKKWTGLSDEELDRLAESGDRAES